jgi:hypothetical protein
MASRRAVVLLLATSPVALVPGFRAFSNGRGGSTAAKAQPSTPVEATASRQLTEPGLTIQVPQLAGDGLYPAMLVSHTSPYQGGALRVTVNPAVSGTARLFGRSYVLAPSGEGIEGYVGVGVADPPGVTTLDIDVVEPNGGAFRVSYDVWVLETEWTVDHIWIPPPTPTPEPDPNAPPPPTPPPPPPDETPLLPGIYAGVTARKWRPGWQHPLGAGFNVTGYFGEQRSFNGGPVQGHHGGTDFGANFGTPIHATNDGVVVMSGLYLIRGNLVVVDHGAGVFSLYGHMEERAVAVGDGVAQGEVLGYVGSTGLSTGAHLHWEMSAGGVLVDGLRWLDGSQGF